MASNASNFITLFLVHCNVSRPQILPSEDCPGPQEAARETILLVSSSISGGSRDLEISGGLVLMSDATVCGDYEESDDSDLWSIFTERVELGGGADTVLSLLCGGAGERKRD